MPQLHPKAWLTVALLLGGCTPGERVIENSTHDAAPLRLHAAADQHYRQSFLNYLTHISDVSVQLSGPASYATGDSLTVTLFDGCGTRPGEALATATLPIDITGLEAEGSW